MKNEILNGDCLDVMKGIGDGSIDCIVTDPPYGIDFQSAWRTDKTQWKPKIANDKQPYIWWLKEAYRVLKDGGSMLCFTRFDTENDFRWAMKIAGFIPKAQVIWDKEIHGMGDLKGDFAPQHENIIFATKGRYLLPGKRPRSIFKVQRVNAERLVHPNEKPIALLEQLIESISKEGETVLDPFAGSGSSAVAAKNKNRNFIGIEVSEEYCNLARNRVSENGYQTTVELANTLL